jgi:predicted N-acetyltransferase YhbS
LEIRQERAADHEAVYALNAAAFDQKDESDLIERIRKGKYFVPELSLVAELDGRIVGHILFSKIKIKGETESESLALAPMAVLPEFQRRGIGGSLVNRGLEMAKALGFESVIVLGHAEYYPRFGFEKASKWEIACPFEVPDEVFMAIELIEGALSGKAGTVIYPPEFGI